MTYLAKLGRSGSERGGGEVSHTNRVVLMPYVDRQERSGTEDREDKHQF